MVWLNGASLNKIWLILLVKQNFFPPMAFPAYQHMLCTWFITIQIQNGMPFFSPRKVWELIFWLFQPHGSLKQQDKINAAVNDLQRRALNEGERKPQESLNGVGKKMRQGQFSKYIFHFFWYLIFKESSLIFLRPFSLTNQGTIS